MFKHLCRLHRCLLPLPCLQIGKRHEFSAGLLIGGKAVAEEATRVNAMNILVATPGG
jgi:superfamily II DNA/RNA helicase